MRRFWVSTKIGKGPYNTGCSALRGMSSVLWNRTSRAELGRLRSSSLSKIGRTLKDRLRDRRTCSSGLRQTDVGGNVGAGSRNRNCGYKEKDDGKQIRNSSERFNGRADRPR